MVEDAVVAKRIKSLGNYFGVQFLLDCMKVLISGLEEFCLAHREKAQRRLSTLSVASPS